MIIAVIHRLDFFGHCIDKSQTLLRGACRQDRTSTTCKIEYCGSADVLASTGDNGELRCQVLLTEAEGRWSFFGHCQCLYEQLQNILPRAINADALCSRI